MLPIEKNGRSAMNSLVPTCYVVSASRVDLVEQVVGVGFEAEQLLVEVETQVCERLGIRA